jgi:hypothetical protein
MLIFESLKVALTNVLILVLMAYALLLMICGPRRAGAVMSAAIGGTLRGGSLLAWRIVRFVVMGIFNTVALVLRLTANIANPQGRAEAMASYVERMGDLLFN